MARYKIPVVLLDYETGEYIDEYEGLEDCAADMEVGDTTVRRSFGTGKNLCAVGIMKQKKILIMKKDAFLNLLKTAHEHNVY